MFFQRKLTESISLAPEFFRRDIDKVVIAQLNQRVQGKTLGTLGYVIWIISVDNITSGKIDEDTGHATFVVEFSAIILRPLPREVMDCKVLDVDEFGVRCSVGPLDVFVAHKSLPEEFRGNYMRDEGVWRSGDGEVEIRRGAIVRVRTTGIVVQGMKMSAYATMDEHLLGVRKLA